MGGLELNEEFLVDFGKELDGLVRVYEIRFFGGDLILDIWGELS